MEPASTSTNPETTPRRGFLAAAGAIVIGAIISLAPLAAGVAFFLDPILRKRSPFKGGDADGFLEVTNLSDLPDDGTPLRFVLRADKLDAWNMFKDQAIGTVYLRKFEGNQVIAFNDTCPHLGCKVDYQQGKGEYLCPCHASAFTVEGKPTNKIPPRGLDVLQAKVDANNKVWVKYQEFRSGIEKQEAVG